MIYQQKLQFEPETLGTCNFFPLNLVLCTTFISYNQNGDLYDDDDDIKNTHTSKFYVETTRTTNTRIHANEKRKK